MFIMVGNPYRWRATIPQMENRNATAGCLLSVLFFVPYLIKSGMINSILVILAVIAYVTLIVPLLTGILSKKTLFHYIRSTLATISSIEFWKDMFHLMVFIADWSHFLYLQVGSAHSTIMQVNFNLIAEYTHCPEQRLCCLYVLLFYCVIAYLHRSLQNRPWANLWSQESTTAEILKLTTVFMIVRLGKAVVMTLVMLTITSQFRHMDPPLNYIILTLVYFCLTQYQGDITLLTALSELLAKMNVHWLEGMEELIVPFVMDLTVVAIAVLVGGSCLFHTGSYLTVLIFSYTNVIVPTIKMRENTWEPLKNEWLKIKRFPFALWSNPEVRSGGLCAICLDRLKALSSRITPCGHVFHGACLRKSLHYTPWCPLCKHPL